MGSPALPIRMCREDSLNEADGSRLLDIILSDCWIRRKVWDPLLCLSVCGCEDNLNEAVGSRLLDIKLSDYRIRRKVMDPLLCLSVRGCEDSLKGQCHEIFCFWFFS
jgi:hypothetical protein